MDPLVTAAWFVPGAGSSISSNASLTPVPADGSPLRIRLVTLVFRKIVTFMA